MDTSTPSPSTSGLTFLSLCANDGYDSSCQPRHIYIHTHPLLQPICCIIIIIIIIDIAVILPQNTTPPPSHLHHCCRRCTYTRRHSRDIPIPSPHRNQIQPNPTICLLLGRVCSTYLLSLSPNQPLLLPTYFAISYIYYTRAGYLHAPPSLSSGPVSHTLVL